MLTQCPNCDTTFRVTSEILRVAQGQVCCGRCDTQFDALERLIEEDETVEAEDPESADEFATDAGDLQLSEPDLDEQDEAQPADAAQEEEEEEWVEFDDIEAEGDITVASEDSELVDQFAEETEEEIEAAVEEEPEEETYADAAEAEEEDEEEEDEEEYEDAAEPEEAQEYEDESEAPEQPEVTRARAFAAAPGRVRSNPYVPERRSPPQPAISRRAPAFDDTDQFEFNKPSMRMPSPAVWKYLALPLVLLFMVQVFNQYSARLARNPRFGNAVTSIYGVLGMDLIPDWNLRAYDIKIYRVLGNPKNGTLRVRASIRNRAAFPQPYPMLKLVLEDRFGEAVRAREFKPTEYLDKPPPPNARMAPQQEAVVDLIVIDPGTDAAGSRLDACLLGNNGSVCAEDLPTIPP